MRENLSCRIVLTPSSKHENLTLKVQTDPSFKGAYARSLRMVLYSNQKSPKHLRSNICKEVLMTVPVVMYTRKDFYLLYMINMKLEMLRSAGLIDYWQFQFANEDTLNVKEQKYPRELKLYQMLGCFYLLLIGCTIAFVIFVIEILVTVI